MNWDERYQAADGYLFGEEPNAFLKRQAHLIRPDMKTLAVADGEGRNGIWLTQQGANVVSVDGSIEALDKARRLASLRNIEMEFQHVDLLRWEWPQQAFDAIVAIFIQFVGPSDMQSFFDGMKGALKPGGLLLLEGYRLEQLAYGTGGPPNAEHMYDENLLRRSFADFNILSLSSYDAHLEEGLAHSGMSALIDLVATKPSANGV